MPQRRRVLAALAAGPASGAAPVFAQQSRRVPVVGYLSFGAGEDPVLEPLRTELRALGWVEGSNLTIERRWAGGRGHLATGHAAELAARQVDLIVAWSTPAARAARDATRVIPIVMADADPLASHASLTTSLSRPSGNVTGTTSISAELMPKRFELVREILPGLGRVGFLGLFHDHTMSTFQSEIVAAAGRFGIWVQSAIVERPEDLEDAFAALERQSVGAVLVQPILAGGLQTSRRMTDVASRHGLPWISDFRIAAEGGALAAYGASTAEQVRNVAGYVDRILRGAKPGDLPIQQPTVFELVVNLKIARALGIAIPPAVLLRADEVIE